MSDTIKIGGIARNKTKLTTEAGDMEEVVNLRRKDGVLRPLCANEEIWQSLNEESPKYSQLFLHTGKTYKHVLGVRKSDHAIVYVGEVHGDDVSLVSTETGVMVSHDEVQVHQVGNLVVVSDTEKVQYFLWKDGRYHNKSLDLNTIGENGGLMPDGLSQLRVVPNCNEDGVPQILVTNGKISDNENPDWDSIKNNVSEIGQSMIAQVRKVAKEKGLLNGFCVGVVVYQLYDGSYAYASRPILLSQPCDTGTRYEEEYGLEDFAEAHVGELPNSVQRFVQKASAAQDDMPPLATDAKKHNYRYKQKAMNVLWERSGFYTANEYKPTKRAYFWNGTTRETLKEQNNEISEACKQNCEIYWGGGEQGYNVGGIYKTRQEEAGEDGGYVTSGFLPLYKRDHSKETDEDVHIPMGLDLFTMAIRGKTGNYLNCFQEQDTPVTIRGSLMQEVTIPLEARLQAGNTSYAFQRGADCFNPPNCFAVASCEPANNNDLVHNYIDSRQIGKEKQAYAFAMTNNLQVKIGAYSEDYSDVIENVCVFISSEIYSADENKGDMVTVGLSGVTRTGTSTSSRAVRQHGATIYANPKKDEELAKELKDVQVLYKVWEQPYKTCKTGEWIDIDLSKKLNVLENLETLNVDSITGRSGMSAKCSYLYNGRLHLGNIDETYFDGYPLAYHEIPEQWDKKAVTSFSRSVCCAYDFRDSSGKDTIEPAFNLIRSEGARLYAAYKFTTTTDDGHAMMSVGDLFTYNYEGDECAFVRYIDEESGQYYTLRRDGTRIDASLNTYYRKNVDGEGNVTWQEYTVTEVSYDDDTQLVFQETSEAFTYWYDSTKLAEMGELWYTHHGDEHKGFWEKVGIPVADILRASLYGITKVSEFLLLNRDEFVRASNEKLKELLRTTELGSHQNAADRYFLSRLFGIMYWRYDICKQWDRTSGTLGDKDVYTIYEIDTKEGKRVVGRVERRSVVYPLNPMLSYPDHRAVKMRIGWIDEDNNTCHEVEYALEPFKAIESAVYVSPNAKPIEWWNDAIEKPLAENENLEYRNGQWYVRKQNNTEDRRNVMKVSNVENPLVFPAANTYQVGNGEIRGFSSNTVGLSTGQWGDAPLYAFCSDGVYVFTVDASGALVYPNSRPISREVCNNSGSITPIDSAVVFSSERGLQTISGASVVEISEAVEGRVLNFSDKESTDFLQPSELLLNHKAWIEEEFLPTKEEAKEYFKNAHIGWNYDDREVWVANPNKEYCYIFSNGLWSKAMHKIEYFINDYPSTYYVEGGKVYDMARDRKDVPVNTFFLTRPIVLSGETAKTFTKAWLYGDFDVADNGELNIMAHKASILVFGSEDGDKFGLIGIGGIQGRTRNVLAKLHRMAMRYVRVMFVGRLNSESRLEVMQLEEKIAWGRYSSIKQR